MPIIATVASTAIGAGVAINSANQQKGAAKDALNAQTAANDKSLAAQEAARQQITQLQAPFQSGGELGMAALLERLGLTHNGTPTGQSAPDPYYGYQSMTGQGQPGGQAQAQTPEYTDSHTIVPITPNYKQGSPGGIPAAPDTGQGVTLPANTPSAPQQGPPDWNAYLQANPDVMQWAQAGHGDPNVPIEQQTLQQRAAYQWAHEQQAYGSAPRALTYLPGQPSNTNTAPNPQGAPSTQAPDLTNAARPGAPPVPTYARPDQGTMPDFGSAPSQSQFFDPSLFHTDPGFDFALAQGQRNLNANFGARGLLKSGAALQGAIDYGQGMANQQYGNWFNRQTSLYNAALGQYNTDRSYGTNLFNSNRTNANQNFENDRSYGTNLSLNNRDYNNNNFTADRQYQTNQNNTATGNLFSLAQIGQNAAGAVGGAGQTYANNASNIFGSQADAASAAAQSRAGANAGMVGSIGGAASNLFNSYSGFSTPFGSPQTVGNAYPSVSGASIQTNVPGLTTFNPPVF